MILELVDVEIGVGRDHAVAMRRPGLVDDEVEVFPKQAAQFVREGCRQTRHIPVQMRLTQMLHA